MAIHKKVPAFPLKGMVEERIYIAKSGNDVRAFTIVGGKVYEISLVAKESAPSSGGSGGTTDHSKLDNLGYDTSGHTGFVDDSGDTITGQLLIDGGADEIQLRVQGNGTQTSNIFEIETSAAADQFTVSNAGKAFIAGEAEIDGDLNHDGSNVGFYGTAPASQPAALTQTYSTSDRTLSAYTADDESSAYTGIDNAQAGVVYAQVSDLNALRTAYENLRAFVEDGIQFLNALTDDMQLNGLEQ